MKLLENLHVSETGMVFDPRTGDSFQINSSAKAILTWLQQGLSTEEIAGRLSVTFLISTEQALTDTLEFQVQLKVMGLLT